MISEDARAAGLGHCLEVLGDATVQGPSSSHTSSRNST